MDHPYSIDDSSLYMTENPLPWEESVKTIKRITLQNPQMGISTTPLSVVVMPSLKTVPERYPSIRNLANPRYMLSISNPPMEPMSTIRR
jgi:hypothetical protein